ncbi:NADH-quinone oxidoreductase subunit G [Helicobacter cappadocius]|uniref:NADH-quinone oxidoreductase subunit G n=1 Tax=Helicobacter cappadocius TaxID=3063998 RepID=A0AA90TA59_9HELI|nr:MULTISPECIES: NADH-quinone oxidoreductase subunit G [unclassified Helicobacter]MDO7253710.1 NADH-quinone oxidoreductase subunit G [Helicobacter sp. faydin-H75]MDP2539602.1 NADH-quinone oxidoreductase subunit G [Helicobacter sp. faydin-H76]
MPKITIDEKQLDFKEGQTILEIARKNNIYIPTICYLNGCSPTVACKMCMAEVDGKRVYTCNTKAKDGARVLTQTPEVIDDRRTIMQTYDVNHPLECGVCDKSGECELQDLTLKNQVESQNYSVQDDEKVPKEWAQAIYDPNLCIVCERCVTTCKDNIGEANLKAVKTELHAPDSFKDTMPKDPYSVWSRKQKALIDFVGENPCVDCGECIAVCPVGALGYKNFSYTSNAWELRKISSTCPHCPAGCHIDYQVKHQDVLNDKQKIYRVSNDFHYNPICGAGRFAFDISSSIQGSENLSEAVQKIKNAKAIRIGGDITNEEAFIIEELRKKIGFEIYCEDTRQFQEFSNTFKQKYFPTLSDIGSSDLIISLGSSLKTEIPLLRYAINNALKLNKSTSLIYAHPIKDGLIDKLGRNVISIQYPPQADEVILGALLLIKDLNPDNILDTVYKSKKKISKTTIKEVKKTLPIEDGSTSEEPKEIIEKIEEVIELDYYGLLEECSLNYDKFIQLKEIFLSANAPILVIGQDVYQHKNAKNIAKMLSFLEKNTSVRIVLIPPQTNSVGISLICTLQEDKKDTTEVVGIRSYGDYVIDSDRINTKNEAKHHVDFILPALNQIEATLSNFEYKLLPLKPAILYRGYDLSDIAQAFGLSGESLVDYTHLLPKESGFEEIHYDCLKNYYCSNGEEKRGYVLNLDFVKNHRNNTSDTILNSIEFPKIESFNAYFKYPQAQFSPNTQASENLQTKTGIYTSKENLTKLNLTEGQEICLEKNGDEIIGNVYVDYDLNQDIFVISPSLDNEHIFKQSIFENLTLKECR